MRRRFFPLSLSFFLLFLFLAEILSFDHQLTRAESGIITGSSPSFEQQVLEIVNQERWNHGQLPPLKGVDSLHGAAETHSTNMALRDFFAHCDFDTNTNPGDRMQAAGYTNFNYAGENIAAGYSTPIDVMSGWMSSSGHRGNILSTNYREIGIGYYRQDNDQGNIRSNDDGSCNPTTFNSGPYTNYWTQNFGRRNEVMPVVINREAYETTSRMVDLYMYGSGWASSMRFRNAGGSWSSWQPYLENSSWTLTGCSEIKTVEAEISSGANGTGTIRTATDSIVYNNGINGAVLSASPVDLVFAGYSGNNPTTMTTTITILNDGDETLNWSLSENPAVDWLAASSTNGTLAPCTATAVTTTAAFTGLSLGVYQTELVIDAGSAVNAPQTIPVMLLYTDQPPTYLPSVLK